MAAVVLLIAILGVCAYILYPLFADAEPRSQSRAKADRLCPQCGRPARPADRFCSACGARLS